MAERYAVYWALCPIELGIFCVVLAPNLNIGLLQNTLTYLFSGVEWAHKRLIDLNKEVGEFVQFHSYLLQYLSFAV
jgi:hypothetical protein